MNIYTQPKLISAKTRLPNRALRRVVKNVCMTLAWPTVCLAAASALSAASGRALFQSADNLWVFLGTVLTTFIAMWALNTNLNSGRMDFALGATGILAALSASKLLGGVISFNTPSGIALFILATTVLGMLIGLVGGLVYIVTRVPAIVSSLGMCLVFEGLAAIIEGRSGQIKYRPSAALAARFTSQPENILPILAAVIVVMSLIICYSRFGYNKNALVYNQKIAVDTGIGEVKSCVICYLLAGALIGLYEALTDLSSTYMNISVDLGSASTVFRNFLPIFIGSMMARYSNQLISSFSACVAATVLARGLDNAGVIGITSPISSIITSVMILGVLTYMVDKYTFINWLRMRRYLWKQRYLGLSPHRKKEEQT